MGMIEVVRNAKTVYRIQREASKLAAIQVDSSQLHKWIRDQNPSGPLYEAAVDTFTRSCAGYCVATFVLGIGDRHPDNIMVNNRGQVRLGGGGWAGQGRDGYNQREGCVEWVDCVAVGVD